MSLGNDSTLAMFRTLMREGAAYVHDLVQLFGTELGEKVRSLRVFAMLLAAAAVFLLFSLGLLTVALVGAISYGLGSWRWALLIVGVAWGILGLFLMLPAAHGLRHGLLTFDATQRRIKDDAEWIKTKLAA